MAPSLQIGRMDVPPDIDAEFNAWYNTIYVPNYEKVPGVIRGRRYRAVVGTPTYLTLYEFEHPAVSESAAWLAQRDVAPETQRSGRTCSMRRARPASTSRPSSSGRDASGRRPRPHRRDGARRAGRRGARPGLTEHALPFTHRAGFEPLAVFARDRNGVLVGGVHGHVN